MLTWRDRVDIDQISSQRFTKPDQINVARADAGSSRQLKIKREKHDIWTGISG